jgi:hypothetical protein
MAAIVQHPVGIGDRLVDRSLALCSAVWRFTRASMPSMVSAS